jgi:hypothetical protein
MSAAVQRRMDAIARRLLAEERDRHPAKAPTRANPHRLDGVSDDAHDLSLAKLHGLHRCPQPLPLKQWGSPRNVDLLMDGEQVKRFPLTDGLDPLALLLRTQGVLPTSGLAHDPDCPHGTGRYRNGYIVSNPASRRSSPNNVTEET